MGLFSEKKYLNLYEIVKFLSHCFIDFFIFIFLTFFMKLNKTSPTITPVPDESSPFLSLPGQPNCLGALNYGEISDDNSHIPANRSRGECHKHSHTQQSLRRPQEDSICDIFRVAPFVWWRKIAHIHPLILDILEPFRRTSIRINQ